MTWNGCLMTSRFASADRRVCGEPDEARRCYQQALERLEKDEYANRELGIQKKPEPKAHAADSS